MFKVVSVTVKNRIEDSNEKYNYNEFKELNELLSDKWQLNRTEIVNNNTDNYFSVIFYLIK